METGFQSLKELLEVLLVPLSVGLIAVLWPEFGARKRRANFERLIRRELAEAAPYAPNSSVNMAWHEHMTRRFLHEEIIRHPTENVEFVLSLKPELAYSLSQMWIAYDKAAKEAQAGKGPTPQHAGQFLWYLRQTIRHLDRGGKSDLTKKVLTPWEKIIETKYPETRVAADTQAP
jgi:hypothetical protein